MIVQCPSCASRYRVNDANIPPSGGKIRCPSCSHAFVVYPEAEEQGDADNTSIAERPNLEELLSSMQQKGADASDQPEENAGEEVAKTEVMSGSELPDFSGLFGGDPPDGNQTVEMSNPLLSGLHPSKMKQQEDELHTQELNSDIVDASLANVREQVASRPPIEPPEDHEPSLQIAPPPMRDQIPRPQHQKRISVPDNPTPPPRGQQSAPPASPPGNSPRNIGSSKSSTGFNVPGSSSSLRSGPPASPPPASPPPASPPPASPPPASPPPASPPPASPPSASPPPASPPSASPPPASPPSASPPPASPPNFGSTPSSPSNERPEFGSTPAPAAAPQADGPDPNHEGPWKLQTNFGLTYEFADNKSLKNWLESRDDLEGYKLSEDGKEFYPLDEFPQIQGRAAISQSGGNRGVASSGSFPHRPSGPNSGPVPRAAGMGAAGDALDSGPQQGMGSGPMGRSPMNGQMGSRPMSGQQGSGPLNGGNGEGQRSPFTTANAAVSGPGPSDNPEQGKQKIDPNESFRPPSRDKVGLNIILWVAFGVLALAALALTAHLAEVVDLGELTGLTQEEVVVPEPVIEEASEEAADEEEEESRDSSARNSGEVDRILESARGELESNRLSRAMELLNLAESIDSERIQLYDMKAEVHEKLNEMDKADEMRDRARQLRREGGGAPPPAPAEED